MNSQLDIDQTQGIRKWRIIGWSVVVAILLAPLIGMQFSDEVAWTLSDFIIAGIMLGGTGLIIELAVRKSRNGSYRVGVAVAVITSLLLLWINGAVGIIGSEDNPLNLMFFFVILVAFLGSILTRFQADGMARTMVAAAVTQAVVAIVALVAGYFTLIISGHHACRSRC